MILEAYIWALSKAVPGARKAGLVYEVAGIAGRFRRHKKAWEPHLNTTRRLIAEAAANAPADKPILVLGAGLGLDLPVKNLAAHKGGAHLCDAVETPSLRRTLRQYPTLSFERIDLTGMLNAFWADTNCDTIEAPAVAPVPAGDWGLVISCNILSQLPLSFAASPPTTDTEARITAAIQKAHIDALNRQACPILLITDYERRDEQKTQQDIIPSVPPHLLPGNAFEEWDWHIAPKGELGKDRTVTLKVGAWRWAP